MNTGLVLAIERCSLHDGPGIRTTVFLKGCPLRCQWCHNPESQAGRPELYFLHERCSACGACAQACPSGCHAIEQGLHRIDRSACDACGACVRACPQAALEIKGERLSVAQVMADVVKDRAFFDGSGGGLTISGGEPLAQASFTRALLQAAKTAGIHTCIETSGFGQRERLLELLPLTDLFLFDWKQSDRDAHQRQVGVAQHRIHDNLIALSEAGAHIRLRCPVIPGINDRDSHFQTIARLANDLAGIEAVEVMPYHPMGRAKSERIGSHWQLPDLAFVDETQAASWRTAIAAHTALPVC